MTSARDALIFASGAAAGALLTFYLTRQDARALEKETPTMVAQPPRADERKGAHADSTTEDVQPEAYPVSAAEPSVGPAPRPPRSKLGTAPVQRSESFNRRKKLGERPSPAPAPARPRRRKLGSC